MNWYHAALLAGAVAAAGLARNVPRAVFWIVLGVLSFVSSSWWHDAGLPYATAFGAVTNLVICYVMYALAQYRYELRVWNAFHLMIVLDLLYMAGIIGSHYTFAVSLELANWLALIVIGATGILERSRDGGTAFRGGPGWARSLHRALLAKRKHPPFWQAG